MLPTWFSILLLSNQVIEKLTDEIEEIEDQLNDSVRQVSHIPSLMAMIKSRGQLPESCGNSFKFIDFVTHRGTTPSKALREKAREKAREDGGEEAARRKRRAAGLDAEDEMYLEGSDSEDEMYDR